MFSCVRMGTYAGQKSMSYVFLPLPWQFLIESRAQEALGTPPVSAFPVLEFQVHKATPGFLHGVRDLNSRSYL